MMVVLAVLAVGFAAWRLFLVPSYDTVKVTKGKAVQSVYATGSIEPVYWSKISPAIAGQISEILAKEGQQVNKGEVLARLEDKVERAQLAELHAKRQYLTLETERQLKLRARNVASKRTYEKVLSLFQEIKAEIKAQEQLLERMVVSSPMDGVVLKRDIELGEYVKSGDVIMWVGLTTPLRVTADVDEEDIPLVRKGQKVLIKADAFPGEIHEGMVSKITLKGDPVSKNFRVRVGLPADTKFLIGMTVEINVIAKEVPEALLVPKSSVINNKLWLVKGGKAIATAVKVGIVGEEKIQIVKGVKEGEAVVLNPLRHREELP